MSDRICIASQGANNFHISAEDLVSCCGSCGAGCDGKNKRILSLPTPLENSAREFLIFVAAQIPMAIWRIIELTLLSSFLFLKLK